MSEKKSRMKRRTFLKGMGAVAGGAIAASCAPKVTPTEAPAPTEAGAAAATEAPVATEAPKATEKPAAPAIKYADEACVIRYITGGYTTGGSEYEEYKKWEEDKLREEYGLNVDIQFESATWADIDPLMDLRVETQGTDSLQRYSEKVLRWIGTPGLIQDLEVPIAEYGQTLYGLYPEVGWKYWMREDQKPIAIPAMRSTPCDIEYLHIRRDWLDKIDRDVPTTIEELEEVMILFMENNLGGDVTIPMMNENPSWVYASFLSGPWVPSAEEQFQMMADGQDIKRGNGSTMREGRLDTIQRWIAKGLFNPEWASWNYDAVYDTVSKGQVGVLSGGWWLLNGTLQTQVEVADPSQDWVQIFPPVGLKDRPGTGAVQAGGAVERGIVVTTWAECPEAIVALAEWQNKDINNYMACRYGIPGKHWEWGGEVGNSYINDLRSPSPNQEYTGLRMTTWSPRLANISANLPPMPGKEPKDPEITPSVYKTMHTRSAANVPEQGEYPTVTQIDHWCPYIYDEANKYLGDLDTLRKEYFAQIVNGELDVVSGLADYWDKWYAGGGDILMQETVDIYNAWIAANPEWEDPKALNDPDFWRTERPLPPAKEA